jgi:hypothetical protein
VLTPRFTLNADRLTFHDVLLFAARFTLNQNLDAGMVNDGLGALNS